MRRIALAILASALTFALAAPAHADGWTDWKTFASHNGVVLEWQTYSHPEHDTKANWRVTNNTTEALYFLFLGTRIYTCSNGSDAFPHMRSSFGGAELSPDSSVTLSDGSANYVTADHIDSASCPSIAEVAFDKGTSWALEFAVGSPLEPERPWLEHTFAANESGESRGSVATCKVGTIQGITGDSCIEHISESESDRSSFRNECRSVLNGEYLADGLCPKKGARVCVYSSVNYGGEFAEYVYDADRFLDHFWPRDHRDFQDNETYWMPLACEGILEGTYMGLQ